MKPAYIEPTASSQRKLAAVWVAALILGLLAIELLQVQIDEMKSGPICDGIKMLRWLWALPLVGMASLGAWARGLRAGRSSSINCRCPVPGSLAVRRLIGAVR